MDLSSRLFSGAFLVLSAAACMTCKAPARERSSEQYATIQVVARDEHGVELGPVYVMYRCLDGSSKEFQPLETWQRQMSSAPLVLRRGSEYEIVISGVGMDRAYERTTVRITRSVSGLLDVVVPLGGRVHLGVRGGNGRFLTDAYVRLDDSEGRRVQPGFGPGVVDGADYYESLLGAKVWSSYRRLPPGKYMLHVSSAGYSDLSVGVVIEDGVDSTVNVVMK